MSATVWFIIAVVGFSLAGIALITAVFMFIKMDIPAIIGDLTGKTVAREIKAMREANVSLGDRHFRSSKVNIERGPLTDKADTGDLNKEAMSIAHASKRLDKNNDTPNQKKTYSGSGNGTVGLYTYAPDATDVFSTNETEVLNSEDIADNATEVLNNDATEVLADNATEVLSDEVSAENSATTVLNGTTVLSSTEELDEEQLTPVVFKVTKSILLTHTDEVIG